MQWLLATLTGGCQISLQRTDGTKTVPAFRNAKGGNSVLAPSFLFPKEDELHALSPRLDVDAEVPDPVILNKPDQSSLDICGAIAADKMDPLKARIRAETDGVNGVYVGGPTSTSAIGEVLVGVGIEPERQRTEDDLRPIGNIRVTAPDPKQVIENGFAPSPFGKVFPAGDLDVVLTTREQSLNRSVHNASLVRSCLQYHTPGTTPVGELQD